MLKELEGEFETSPYVFFSSIKGVNVAELTELRRSLAAKVRRSVVVKHTLARKVFKKRGLEEKAGGMLKDSILVTFGQKEPQDISKILVEFLKAHEKFALQGAIMDGEIVGAAVLKELAKLPGRQVLLGRVVSGIHAPVSRLVLTLGGLIRALVSDLNQITEKKKS